MTRAASLLEFLHQLSYLGLQCGGALLRRTERRLHEIGELHSQRVGRASVEPGVRILEDAARDLIHVLDGVDGGQLHLDRDHELLFRLFSSCS